MDNSNNQNKESLINIKSSSNLILNNRNLLSLTGVKKVKSTEPSCVTAVLDNCMIIVSGNNLTVQQLNIEAGTLDLTGVVTSIKYTNSVSKKFSFKNMFK